MPGAYQAVAYYCPFFHADPRREARHGVGWTEWDLLRHATPRFPGHQQPKVPRWGYEDEASAVVCAKKIEVAANHGIDCLLFNWYWYDGALFLGRALEEGFMRAFNVHRVKFAIHWANHDWRDVHPAKPGTTPQTVFRGAVDRPMFDHITRYIIERYFTHPSYWQIDGRPFVSINELRTLVHGLGGARETRDALKSFDERTRAAGFAGLHLNAVWHGVVPPDGQSTRTSAARVLRGLGFSSVTSYTWAHDVDVPVFPQTDYERVAKQAAAHWHVVARSCGLPYFPNVTMGWDPSPRTVQSDRFAHGPYPFGPSLGMNSPRRFARALELARHYLDATALRPKVMVVNAWNNWTEGSYLEPDTLADTRYLDAVRDVLSQA
jgi:hypothetical protein